MHRLRQRLYHSSGTHQIGLKDLTRLAVLGSAAFLVWVPFGGFPDFVQAFVSEPLADAPESTLRLLGKPSVELQDTYRQGLSIGVTLMCAVWMGLWRAARRRGLSLGTAGWLGLACVLVALVLLNVPYRTLIHPDAEQARYDKLTCYVTGQSPDAFLLFCPTRAPRVLSVNRSDPLLERLGTVGKVFDTIK